MLVSRQEDFFPFRLPEEEPPAVFLSSNLEKHHTAGIFLISRSWVIAKTSAVACAEEGASNFRLLCRRPPRSEGTSSSHRWDLPHRERGLPGSSQAAAFSHPITVRHMNKERGNQDCS